MDMPDRVLRKPHPGQPCNGCGYCCIESVCLLGLELGNRKHCAALMANSNGSFSCGLVADPYAYLSAEQSATWKKIDELSAGAGLQALKDCNAHLLGAGRGCDSVTRSCATQ